MRRNAENINKLADFIESGKHEWGFDTQYCFIGQYAEMIGSSTYIINSAVVREFLGVPRYEKDYEADVALTNFFFAWSAITPNGEDLTREEAVRLLRNFAETGEIAYVPE